MSGSIFPKLFLEMLVDMGKLSHSQINLGFGKSYFFVQDFPEPLMS